MADGYWAKWDSVNKKWLYSTDGGGSFADVVENITTEQIIANPVAAPAGIVSKGILYYDSTANKFYVKENNGAAVAIANIAAYTPPVTTKGDIFVFGAAADRLPVGSNSQLLVPDSAVALGLKWFTPPACVAFRGSNQSINNTTETAILFDSEVEDTGTLHSTSTNTSRITVPIAGKYLVTGAITFAFHATGDRTAKLYKGGANFKFLGGCKSAASGSTGTGISFAQRVTLAANDYLEIFVYQSSGGALNIVGDAAGIWTSFNVAWVGA